MGDSSPLNYFLWHLLMKLIHNIDHLSIFLFILGTSVPHFGQQADSLYTLLWTSEFLCVEGIGIVV